MMRKLLLILLACSFVALSYAVFCPIPDTFAAKGQNGGRNKQRIEHAGICVPDNGKCMCVGVNDFTQYVRVWLRGGRDFVSGSEVRIYVVPSQDWIAGETFDPYPVNPKDVTGFIETSKVGGNGDLGCEMIWENPAIPGDYDIICDANKNGIFDKGDAVCSPCFVVIHANAPPAGGNAQNAPPVFNAPAETSIALSKVHAMDVLLIEDIGTYDITAELKNSLNVEVEVTAKAAVYNAVTNAFVDKLADKVHMIVPPRNMGGRAFVQWNELADLDVGIYRVTVTVWADPPGLTPLAKGSVLFDANDNGGQGGEKGNEKVGGG